MTQEIAIQKQDFTINDIRQLLLAKGKAVEPSDAEIGAFLKICQGMGANPFLGDIHLVKYSHDSPASTITGKDYFTKIARSLGGSWKAGLIIQRGDEMLEEEGEFKLKSDVLLGGWSEVKTQDGGLFKSRVSIEEYSSNQSTWKKMPHTMIRKVALVHSLREAYPERLGGVYDSSEMQQAIPAIDLLEAVEDAPPVTLKKPEAQNVLDIQPEYQPTPSPSAPEPSAPAQSGESITAPQINYLQRLGYQEDPTGLSKREASSLISELQEEQDQLSTSRR